MADGTSRVLSTRDQRICDLRAEGRLLEEIAAEVGLTRERVRQILVKVGGPTLADVRARQQAERESANDEITQRIGAAIRAIPGSTVDDLATMLGVEARVVRALVPPDLKAFVVIEQHGTRTWTDERMLDAIRDASTYEFPLTAKTYSNLVRTGEVSGPSLPRVGQRFGSWTRACGLAGVESGRAIRDYQSTWTDDDLLAFVAQYLSSADAIGTFEDYNDWRAREAPDAPSGPTIRNRLGAWSTVKRSAAAVVLHGVDADA